MYELVPAGQADATTVMDLPALLQAIMGHLHTPEQQRRHKEEEEAARKLQLVEQRQQQEQQQRLKKEQADCKMQEEVMKEVLQRLWQQQLQGSMPRHLHKQPEQEVIVYHPAWRGGSTQPVAPQVIRLPLCCADQKHQQHRQQHQQAAAGQEKGSKAGHEGGLAAVVRRLDALEEENRRLRGLLEASQQREREQAASLEREQRRVKQLRDLLL